MAQSDFDRKVLGLEQQKALAQKLRQSAFEDTPQGQMVSGWYVAPSWSQYLAQGLKGYAGYKGTKEAEQGIESAYGEREKQKQDLMASFPAGKTSEDALAWSLKAAEIDPALGQYGNAYANMAETRATRQAQAEATAAERQSNREWQAALEKDRQAARQANTVLAASLRPQPQATAQPKPIAVIGADGKPTYVAADQAVGMQPYMPAKQAPAAWTNKDGSWMHPPTAENPEGVTLPNKAKLGALKNIDYLVEQFVGKPSDAANGITLSTRGLLDKTETGGFMGTRGKLGYVTDYQSAKEFDNKRVQLSTELRKIFRIPGEGALSDKDLEQYNLQLPSRDFDPEVNQRILQDLKIRAMNEINPMGAVMPGAPSQTGGSVLYFDMQGKPLP